MERKCNKCFVLKDISCFGKNKNCKLGLCSICKLCVKEWHRLNYIKNKDHIQAVHKKYRKANQKRLYLKHLEWKAANPEKYTASWKKHDLLHRDRRLVSSRKSYKKHKKRRNEESRLYQAKKRKTDPIFKLKQLIRSRLNQCLKSNYWHKDSHFKDYIGCTEQELKIYIESQFKPGMTWENHGKNTWNIDHIVPLYSAKTPEELIKLNHYTNLRPLWKEEHVQKSIKEQKDSLKKE